MSVLFWCRPFFLSRVIYFPRCLFVVLYFVSYGLCYLFPSLLRSMFLYLWIDFAISLFRYLGCSLFRSFSLGLCVL